ncbi:HDL243Cp [Eremothecium sinecaudum]|uniref:HDL243Cp n=1 Tax=Eremothecium sinecaudum TaxID=45286 RepID=A0A0X8HR78_9SACH|nr:HDL243Cp [Eremothecium sinecaudum]AMD20501.1 HDL243Cp [Eremothecium sinecaudum]
MELFVKKHVKFMDRHLRLLPAEYQQHDPNKMVIIYYAIVGSACLGEDVVEKYGESITWLHSLNMKYVLNDGTRISGYLANGYLRSAEVPIISLSNTLFAALVFLTLGDYEFFETNENKESLCAFVGRCQLKDGSFVSTLDLNQEGKASSTDSKDLRFCYMAVSLLHILGCNTLDDYNKYIDVEKLLSFVMCKCCADGAFGDFGEPHAGYTSCALSLLKLLNKLDILSEDFKTKTIDWLVHRQVSATGMVPLPVDNDNYYMEDHGGFQGRANKQADTCYAFWCLNSLSILDSAGLIDTEQIKEYLLLQTQNKLVGGFGKDNESDPDLYHSYLGIAALSLIDGTFDGILCITKQCRDQWVNSKS